LLVPSLEVLILTTLHYALHGVGVTHVLHQTEHSEVNCIWVTASMEPNDINFSVTGMLASDAFNEHINLLLQ